MDQSKCYHSIPRTECYGIETASSVGPELCDKVLQKQKKVQIP